jgi:Fibronectin type III domain
MKYHAFSPRAAAAAVGMAVLLTGGASTGAMAAVTSTPAPVTPRVITTTTAPATPDTPASPGAPTGLTAAPGDGTATLSWSAPSSDGGSPVDGYLIEGGTSPSAASISDLVSGTTATMSGLTDGTVYYFRVNAQNSNGDGAAATVTVTPRGSGSNSGSGSVPGAPTGLKTSSGDGFIALSWSPPASPGSSPVTGYHVYLGQSSSLAGAREFTTSGPSFRLTDAENGSVYYIKVTALNATGEGPGTAVTSVVPLTTQPGPPAPTGLTAQAYRGEVVLSWSPPPGGLAAGEGYLIYIGTSSGHEGAKPSVPYLIENTTSYTIAPLKDGTRYYFQVALLGGDNQVSARSAEVSAVPGTSAAAGPSAGVGAPSKSGAGKSGQPIASPLPATDMARHHASSSPSAVLIIMLAALALAAAGGAITIALFQRRRRPGRRYHPVPAPRRSYDDQPAGPASRIEEMNGPRYR